MERRKILIATKTYPAISRKYKETVCTAGVLLDDLEQPLQWIRIYPIRFRYLETDRRYPRWSIISAEIERNEKDYREESFRINDESIEIVRKIGTNDNWAERKSLILPLEFSSISDIKQQGKSLGIIKPQKINRYYDKKTEREWSPRQQAIQDQLDLFEPSVELEKIPYQFFYDFVAQDGKRHKCSINDWEIMQLYRNCRNNSQASTLELKEQEALEKVRQKLVDDFLNKKDLYFIVGNLKNHKNAFMIIGLFYPQKVEFEQLSLF
ncbi:hypothetical protein H6G33_07615 [Calothrix sp. FACHB-1219]|uniref:hypothetical protein n=1 Tax=unclassified Calothrix TaxID=2619626 RepID=UPI001681D4AE|nr:MULTISPECIES: hypothetical protein [unclassified Calothrix]MBD2207294.1 hypothetical protein [Calothrix sp. FACHB-168]MBD2216895.1 hypothetical protein [Calothrix sp. FACHB-1219]